MKNKVKNQRTKKVCALVTKEMTISEILEKYPETISVFAKNGLHCAGCPMAEPETIKEAAKVHQVDLNKFLNDLNKAAEK